MCAHIFAGTTSVATLLAAIMGTLFKALLQPLHTIKTLKQVNHGQGIPELIRRVRIHGVMSMWNGALHGISQRLVGSFSWFIVYNHLNKNSQNGSTNSMEGLGGSAIIGLLASSFSSVMANSFRVLNVVQSTTDTKDSATSLTYQELLTRGLSSRLLSGIFSSIIFTVCLPAKKDIRRAEQLTALHRTPKKVLIRRLEGDD